MKFTYATEEELTLFPLLEDGHYDFTVIKAEDAVSKSGNEMLKIVLRVWDKAGKEHVIFDYLLEAFKRKLKHFCDATGLADKYSSGELTANDVLNKSAKALINTQPAGNGYAAKNIVVDYVSAKAAKDYKNKDTAQGQPIFDDDVPF